MSHKLRLTFVILLLIPVFAQAQRNKQPKRPPSANEKFLQTQFWIGLKGGLNLTKANPTSFHSAFSAIDFPEADLLKTYDNFKELGSQVGLEFVFYHRGFSVSLFPNYSRFNFSYHNSYEYISLSSPDDQVILNYDQKQHLEYIDLPLMVKYDLMRDKIRPFVQFGAYYGRLVNATKEVSVEILDMASGSAQPYNQPPIIVGAKDLFVGSSFGLIGGIGVNYDPGNIRMSFDINYRYGMNNIADASNRYSENRLSGAGDAMDDFTMDNITMNVGVFFPMRFISSSFNSDF